MSVLNIQAQPLTREAFAPYGTAICIPTDGNPDRPTDRFNFWPKLSLYQCDSGIFQIGVDRSSLQKELMYTLTKQMEFLWPPAHSQFCGLGELYFMMNLGST